MNLFNKAIASLMASFALISLGACSDDDETTNLSNDVIGDYPGYTVASSTYFTNMVAASQSIKITSDEENKANIKYTSTTWGEFTIDKAQLAGVAGNITITGSGKTLMGHQGGAAKEYDCTVSGVLNGKDLSLTFNCPTVMGGLKIEFKQGEIPAEIVVPGTYKGYTAASSNYFKDQMADNQEMKITLNADKTYKVEYTSTTWGEFVIANATAVYENGKFSIKGDGTTKMGMGDSKKDYNCSFTGTIDVAKESPEFTFSMPSVMSGMTILFRTGDMPTKE